MLAVAAIASCAKTEPVYMENEAEIMIAPVTSMATKAQVNQAIDGVEYPAAEFFTVIGYWANEESGSDFAEGTTYLDNVVFEKKAGAQYWSGQEEPCYWPKNGSLRFATYSPSDANAEMAHDLATDTWTATGYTQSNDTDATVDFMVAKTPLSYTAQTAAESVSVVFEHALSWINFKVTSTAVASEAFTITDVIVNNVNNHGNLVADMKAGTKTWSTALPQTINVYNSTTGQTVNALPTVIENADDNGNVGYSFLVLPQPTTSVTIKFTQNALSGTNGTPSLENQEITIPLTLDENQPWEAGKHYTYTIIFDLDEILINPSVVDWDEVPANGSIVLDPDAINVYTAAQLEAALANDAATKIVFQNNIEGDFTVNEVAGRTLTIDGNGYKLAGSFFMDGKSSYTKASTVFANINFETADASSMEGDSFIYCGEGRGTNYRYPDGITVKNCTFTATGAAVEKAVAVKLWALNGDLVVENCYADGLHSLLQLTSCGNGDVTVYGTFI